MASIFCLFKTLTSTLRVCPLFIECPSVIPIIIPNNKISFEYDFGRQLFFCRHALNKTHLIPTTFAETSPIVQQPLGQRDIVQNKQTRILVWTLCLLTPNRNNLQNKNTKWNRRDIEDVAMLERRKFIQIFTLHESNATFLRIFVRGHQKRHIWQTSNNEELFVAEYTNFKTDKCKTMEKAWWSGAALTRSV